MLAYLVLGGVASFIVFLFALPQKKRKRAAIELLPESDDSPRRMAEDDYYLIGHHIQDLRDLHSNNIGYQVDAEEIRFLIEAYGDARKNYIAAHPGIVVPNFPEQFLLNCLSGITADTS